MASVSVIGGGIFGLACAWEMARRGARVRVHEARQICAGSSGGHVGALAPHTPDTWNDKKAFQLDSLLMAPDFWAEVEAVSGLSSGYARMGRLQPVTDPAALQPRLDGAARHWPEGIGMRIVENPASPLATAGLWLEDDLTARLNPRAALQALAGAIRAKGGEVIEGKAAPNDLPGPVIWATGTEGLLALNAATGRKIGQGVKGQSALLDLALPDSPQVFADGLYIVPHADGTTAIGSTSENRFDHDRPDNQIDALLTRARDLCPGLEGAALIETWAGIRPRAQSRAPILGPFPGRPGHFIANGGFKIGFGMAPKIARLMADLILEGRDSIPDGFRLPAA
ncbi:FAD-dependent oxidoreductase [Paracoccus zhejiangensis]|uniref:FAD-dependent oxidoreductase n=1 Tax=Paracoccus zhejiangensis TaxID=1077935 RepID=A0A2H5EZ52_9RHOB|nr:FAD-dependent oxidoreductase [Paracoccus zhejiangensis]AUH64572.1 FAD-dependent oxidoreductase [Paracoccus zhejiangensis]